MCRYILTHTSLLWCIFTKFNLPLRSGKQNTPLSECTETLTVSASFVRMVVVLWFECLFSLFCKHRYLVVIRYHYMFRLFASAVIRQDIVTQRRVKGEVPVLTNSRCRAVIKLVLFLMTDLCACNLFVNQCPT